MRIIQKISLVLAIFIAFLIFYLSSLTFPQSSSSSASYPSFLYHFAIFFFLSSFLLLAVSERFDVFTFSFIILLSLLYASLDELHQHFVPGRAMNVVDLMVNFLGLLSGGVVVGFFRR